jgi:flagellar assembly protein FliH
MAHVLKHDAQTQPSSAAGGKVAGLAGFNLNDLAMEGKQRLEDCRKQVQEMIALAKQDAERLREDARRRGYEEGKLQANVDSERRIAEQAETRAREGLQRLQQAVEQLHNAHDSWMQQYAQSLSRIAIAAAQRVIMHRLDQEPGLLVRWAEEALRSTRSAQRLIVAVHPETLAELGGAFDQLLSQSDLPEQTHVEADESVDRHGVLVRQPGGEINAGLMAQLRRLEEMLA